MITFESANDRAACYSVDFDYFVVNKTPIENCETRVN